MKHQLRILAAAGLVAASAASLQAQTYYAPGAHNGWDTTLPENQMTGGATVYSYVITNGTPDAFHEFKIATANWGTSWPGNNVMTKYDAGGTNTLHFIPSTITDGWSPVQNRVGYDDPGNLTWEIIGGFNGWDGNQPANAQMVNQGNGLYKVDYVVASPGTYEFKFRTPGTWGSIRFGVNFGNDSANASITTTGVNQTVSFQLDLPNGRWLAGNPAPSPVTNNVTFQVDMTAQILGGAFVPGSGIIRVTGSFPPASWGDGLDLTNNPALSGDAVNIYSTVVTLIDLPNTSYAYKFRENGGYESPASTGGGDRTFKLASTSGDLVLPLVYYNDASPCDLLSQDTTVTFRLHLTNHTTAVDGAVFDNTSMFPKINGTFNNWNGGNWDATLPDMINNPVGSDYWEYTTVIPKGKALLQQFKFGLYPPVGANVDNEAPAFQDHIQYIRTSAASFAMPYAEFGTNYAATRVESSFGDLKVGTPSGSAVPITWLGRPCVTLQVRSGLADASWTDIPTTDSEQSTNWPLSTGSAQFFRLQKRFIP